MSSNDVVSIPGPKHMVIALLSGGKDSCFNLLHCQANGHQVVAIATLIPEEGVDELDSHLYQSVGTRLIPFIAQASGLPLYTRVIRGKALERGAEYGSRSHIAVNEGDEGDETEDLYELLREVMIAHPEATALSSGAILSSYQRLRIEHVCSRLGLASLAYLWQQPQLSLLDSMIKCGMEVVIVKVAGVGLGVDVVGKRLEMVLPLLKRLEKEYGSHPAGEGGEYETITLSSPLWSHRLYILSSEVIITDPEPYPVAYLRVETAEIEPKANWSKPSVRELRNMLGLPSPESHLLQYKSDEEDEESEMAEGSVLLGSEPGGLDQLSRSIYQNQGTSRVHFVKRGQWFVLSIQGRSLPGQSVEMELKEAFESLSVKMKENGLSLPIHATHITFLLSSMSLFVAANALYATYFGTSPPSRATVAVPLPPGQRVRLEVIGFDDRFVGFEGRQALHVQSLSYWAPANIGPYSQAVIVNSRVHLAGQIPLLPASLTIPIHQSSHSPYALQSVLALRHVRRVLTLLRDKSSTGGGWEGWCELAICWWASSPLTTNSPPSGEPERMLEMEGVEMDCFETPIIFLQASELPRGALVEYQVNWNTGRRTFSPLSPNESNEGSGFIRSSPDNDCLTPDQEFDEDENTDRLESNYDQETLRGKCSHGSDERSKWEICMSDPIGGGRGLVFLDGMISEEVRSLVRKLGGVSVRVYYTHQIDLTTIQSKLPDISNTCITFIPVLSIHDRHLNFYPLAMDIFIP
ncbi:hypothetical protein M231_04987 [Tremella mesenterica]|uniref:Diphthine--ammonia ligase n=1 Tax=Tremella mesenterica TaxID=5217 RepID=A0A4Q1BJ68_TREME|nr:hypothetical protein M231_04987 [Tremella mesenterica]